MAKQLRTAGKRKLVAAETIKRSGPVVDLSETQKRYEKEPPKLNRVSVWDMVNHMKRDSSIQIEANVLGWKFNKDPKTGIVHKTMESRRITDRKKFLDMFDKTQRRFQEGVDGFGTDLSAANNNLIGNDFIPLLGGPFNKQLYLHDMLEQQALAFFAYHHDAFAHRSVHILRDFTLGKGWASSSDNDVSLGTWQAFEKANKLQDLFRYLSIELSIYGEIMLWWLPDHDTKIEWQLRPGQESAKGLLPRVRLLDPSMVWEIVTYPEDITRVLYYQVVSPTQYQIYTGKDESGQYVPTLKYIFQQIPANQIMHYKVNTVSNEKRGRSDLYPIFGDLKRYRDTIDYSIVAEQKRAAWAMDTTIEGNQDDLNAYVASQEALGSYAPAGSEFVHTSKVIRKYDSNQGRGSGVSNTVDSVFNRCCIGVGIPRHYYGLHDTGSRAGAIVATEPVAKVFEMRQQIYNNILTDMNDRLQEEMMISKSPVEFTFPEIITQDRSAKLKDLALCEIQSWYSHKTAAQDAAKEMGNDTYIYEDEMSKILSEPNQFRAPMSPQAPMQPPGAPTPAPAAPLSTPGLAPKPQPGPSSNAEPKPKTTFDSSDKAKVRNNLGY